MTVFKRPNSPNWYCRYYVREEQKYYQKSLKTKSKAIAQDKAKDIYREITTIISRDEKVFNVSWEDAINIYAEMEHARYLGGVIVEEWYKKKIQFLRNTWGDFVGLDLPVNKTTDVHAENFYRQRLRHLKSKTTLRQEITMVNAIYKDLLIPKNYVLRKLHFPKTMVSARERSRRTDTFTIEEWEVLYKSMRRWVEWDEIPHTRIAVKAYGKKENKEKELNEYHRKLEYCRRNVLREFILISAGLGTRPVSELLNVKRQDVEVKKTLMRDWYKEGNDEWKLTANIAIASRKTGDRNVNGVVGRPINRLLEFYESQGVTIEPDDHLFIELAGRRKGQQIDKYVLNRLWRELMEYAGLTRIKFTPYHLRHFYITQRLINGVDIVLLSRNAGNSPKVIYETYQHIHTQTMTQELNKTRSRKSWEEIGLEF